MSDSLLDEAAGFVLVRRDGEVGANDSICSEADLTRNLLTLIEARGLEEAEIRGIGRLQRERVPRHGPRG
jgi:hypothetical protein